VVLGRQNNFSSFGGLVVGHFNEISGQFASVSGGLGNTVIGSHSSISGGEFNKVSGDGASISGGYNITQMNHVGWSAGSSGGTIEGSFRSPQ
jgi:hypothetical protein